MEICSLSFIERQKNTHATLFFIDLTVECVRVAQPLYVKLFYPSSMSRIDELLDFISFRLAYFLQFNSVKHSLYRFATVYHHNLGDQSIKLTYPGNVENFSHPFQHVTPLEPDLRLGYSKIRRDAVPIISLPLFGTMMTIPTYSYVSTLPPSHPQYSSPLPSSASPSST